MRRLRQNSRSKRRKSARKSVRRSSRKSVRRSSRKSVRRSSRKSGKSFRRSAKRYFLKKMQPIKPKPVKFQEQDAATAEQMVRLATGRRASDPTIQSPRSSRSLSLPTITFNSSTPSAFKNLRNLPTITSFNPSTPPAKNLRKHSSDTISIDQEEKYPQEYYPVQEEEKYPQQSILSSKRKIVVDSTPDWERQVRTQTRRRKSNDMNFNIQEFILETAELQCIKVTPTHRDLLSGIRDLSLSLDKPLLYEKILTCRVQKDTNPIKEITDKQTFKDYLNRSTECLKAFLTFFDSKNNLNTLRTFNLVYNDVVNEYINYKNPNTKDDKTRSFRYEKQLNASSLKERYGYNFLRIASPGSWANQQKEQVIFLVAVEKFLKELNPTTRSIVLGFLYFLAAAGEHDPQVLHPSFLLK